MRKLVRRLSILAMVAFPLCLPGCGGSAPLPGASSPSSEEADAAGGLNKTASEKGAAESTEAAEEGKAPAEETKPAEPKEEEGKTGS